MTAPTLFDLTTPKPTLAPDEIEGVLVRIRFQTPDTGFLIGTVDAGYDEVTVKGVGHGVQTGITYRISGQWKTHPKFGPQFETTSWREVVPTDNKGIVAYLQSALTGIGPTTAQAIVKTFKGETLKVLDSEPERLLLVHGISPKKLETISAEWQAKRTSSDGMIALQAFGLSAAFASRTLEYCKARQIEPISFVRNNPYNLTAVKGIGWEIADRAATALLFASTDPRRIQAGIGYALEQACTAHVYLTEDALISAVEKFLKLSAGGREAIRLGLEEAVASGAVVREADRFYPRHLFEAERDIAYHIRRLQTGKPLSIPLLTGWLQTMLQSGDQLAGQLNSQQIAGIRAAFEYPVSIITGGPGTGKTTISRLIVQGLAAAGVEVGLCSPTGRAAQRLGEATQSDASTIHRLLHWSEGGFTHDDLNPLEYRAILADEFSMVDVLLGADFLQAIQTGSRLVIIGDVDQLPSVGPGAVLRDLIASGVIPVTRLTEVYRQAGNSFIISNAHRLNRGVLPELYVPEQYWADAKPWAKDCQLANTGTPVDFFYIPADEPEMVQQRMEEVILNCEAEFGFDPVTEMQVLSPMVGGPLGVTACNARLQQVLNPMCKLDGPHIRLTDSFSVYVGDKIIQRKNNYRLEIFNGQIGVVAQINSEGARVVFDNTTVVLDRDQLLENTSLAYAITIHRAQGSEFPVIIMPVHSSHFVMLKRNLLYTGITRGKRLVFLVGQARAIGIATKTIESTRRNSSLTQRLQL